MAIVIAANLCINLSLAFALTSDGAQHHYVPPDKRGTFKKGVYFNVKKKCTKLRPLVEAEVASTARQEIWLCWSGELKSRRVIGFSSKNLL